MSRDELHIKRRFFDILEGDKALWVIVIITSVVSILFVYSSTGTLAYKRYGGDMQHFLLRHSVFFIFSLGVMFIIHKMSYLKILRLSKLFFYGSILLLLYTMVGGMSLNQASRWITIPFINLSFQTSDFGKLALMMYLAAMLATHQKELDDINIFFKKLILPILIVCGLILPSDFSTSALLFFSALVLLYIGRVKLTYLFGVVGVGVVAIMLFVAIALLSKNEGRIGTWKSRIESFSNGNSEGHFQSNQAKVAIAGGGVFGKGLGNGVQRNVLPHPYSDFIFAIIIEEGGLMSAIIVILLYLILFYRTGAIVKKSTRVGPALLVAGMMILMVIQAFMHMGVCVGLLPVTGQTLPFISMGGSSLLISSVQMGIILSVSRSIYKKHSTKSKIAVVDEQVDDVDDDMDV